MQSDLILTFGLHIILSQLYQIDLTCRLLAISQVYVVQLGKYRLYKEDTSKIFDEENLENFNFTLISKFD